MLSSAPLFESHRQVRQVYHSHYCENAIRRYFIWYLNPYHLASLDSVRSEVGHSTFVLRSVIHLLGGRARSSLRSEGI